MPVKSLPLNPLVRHIALPLAGLICILLAFFALKWYIANTVSARVEQTTGEVTPKRLAQLAVDLAPNDPQSYYALAVIDDKSFVPEDLPKSLQEFEQATALSPNDYRLWFALGRARDRSGDAEGAEAALRKTLELAPNYAQVQWALGNVLLRRNRGDEGFAMIRRAAENDPALALPLVTTAWQFFDGDVSQVSRAVGDSAPIKSTFSAFLGKQKLYDEAFGVWNSLSEIDKKQTYRPNTDELLKHLLVARKFRDALIVQAQLGAENETPVAEKIMNPGFEADVKPSNAGAFEWQIAEGLQPFVGFDEKLRRSGNRSLALAFNSVDGKDFRSVQQSVVVTPGKKYKFSAFFRSELKTTATLRWEILDAGGQLLAATENVPVSSDWAQLHAEFTPPAGTDGVTIRLARAACNSIVCPISGKVWFDDFNLE